MSLLSIVQDACALCSITVPQAIANNNAPEVQQMRALAQVEADDLSRRNDWRALVRSYSFTTTTTALQADSLPDDFRKIVPGTMYRSDTSRPVLGPVSAALWAYATTTMLPQTDTRWRLASGGIEFTPTPSLGVTVSYEYVSKNWALNVGTGQTAARFVNDNDATVLPEDLIVLGLVWRWKKAKGFDYGEDMVSYERALERASADDGGLQTIVVGTEYDGMPDHVWPGVIRAPV